MTFFKITFFNYKSLVSNQEASSPSLDEAREEESKKSRFSQGKASSLKNRKSSSTPVLTESLTERVNEPEEEEEAEQEDLADLTESFAPLDSTDTISHADQDSANSSFRAYYSSTLLDTKKKMLRHHSLHDTHDKSQSANNLISFVNHMQLTVSEPSVLNDEENKLKIKDAYQCLNSGPPASSSSSYLPLETTMEECLESLDISYEAAASAAPNVLNSKSENTNQTWVLLKNLN